MKDEGEVTSSYVRMHHPDALVGLAKLVRSGKMAQENLDLEVPAEIQSTLGAAPTRKPQRRKPQAARVDSDWALIVANTPFKEVVDYSPGTLVFPPSWDKQTVTTTLHVVSRTDGPLTAKLQPGSPFTIASIKIYDGKITPDGHRSIAAEVTRAPWKIDTIAGQDVDIKLSFSPKFDINTFKAGTYRGALDVKGKYWNSSQPKEPPWNISVPVSAEFKGVRVGVIFLCDRPEVDVVSHPERDTTTFDIPATLINYGAAISGRIEGAHLPEGVSIQPNDVKLAAGETRHINVRVSLWASAGLFMPRLLDKPHAVEAVFRHTGKDDRIRFMITPFSGRHVWSWSDTAVGVQFESDFIMFSNGDFTYSLFGTNGNILDYSVDVTGKILGHDYINMGLNVNAKSNFSQTYGWNVKAFKEHYLQFTRSTLWMKLKASPAL
jgi:hypothetical protein